MQTPMLYYVYASMCFNPQTLGQQARLIKPPLGAQCKGKHYV